LRARETAPPPRGGGNLLEVRGLGKTFVSKGLLGPARPVVAARDVSFRLARGEAVALVGESGSGKSTIARLVLRLDRADAGEIRLDGADRLRTEPGRASPDYRGRVQMVFQDPFASLNPVHDVAYHLARPLEIHGCPSGEVAGRSRQLLRTVGLEPPEEFLPRHPYELSGGQRQRVAIARALAADPDFLVADEPTSMLDVSIRMDVLEVLARLKADRGLGILLITHDLASARFLADRILVLFRGRVVESGPAVRVVDEPAHPYTRMLLGSIADAGRPHACGAGTVTREPGSGRGAPASEQGCPFAHRCPDVMETCRTMDPEPVALDAGRRVRCHLYPVPATEGGEQ
jgi:peptide/nickel transport system ATP-binding protein